MKHTKKQKSISCAKSHSCAKNAKEFIDEKEAKKIATCRISFAKGRKFLEWVLFIFVLATIGLQTSRTVFHGSKFSIPKLTESTHSIPLPEGVSVIVCHAAVRCPTCRAIEAETKKCLEKHFSKIPLTFLTLNYEAPENAPLAERFQLAAASVLLVRHEQGKETFRNLMTEAWQTIGKDEAFEVMLTKNLTQFLKVPEKEVVPPEEPAEEAKQESSGIQLNLQDSKFWE